ncbi:MAG: carotenoid biosynthesis protein [Chloroflexota bacterium]|nr:carotenoid biosynthesis protein [Chloroflexota bacterium]
MPIPDRFWLRLALAAAGGTVIGALVVRLLGIDLGRIGSYLGILIIGATLVALMSGIASRIGWKRAAAAAVLVMVVGGGAEIASLYGGLPFGRYEFTDWWLPYVMLPGGKLYPLLLPPSWFIFVTVCYLVLARRLLGWRLVVGSAALTTLVDLVLEPVLTRVVLFWRWLEPTPLLGAPYRNVLGWLVTAGLAACCLQSLRIWQARDLPHPVWLLSLGVCCTALIGLAHDEPRAALALTLLPVVVWARRRS